jgi:hypothetical protein
VRSNSTLSTIRKPLALSKRYEHRRNYAIAAEQTSQGVVSLMVLLKHAILS